MTRKSVQRLGKPSLRPWSSVFPLVWGAFVAACTQPFDLPPILEPPPVPPWRPAWLVTGEQQARLLRAALGATDGGVAHQGRGLIRAFDAASGRFLWE